MSTKLSSFHLCRPRRLASRIVFVAVITLSLILSCFSSWAQEPKNKDGSIVARPGTEITATLDGKTEKLILRDGEPEVKERTLGRSCPLFLWSAVVRDFRSGTDEACSRPIIPKPLKLIPEEQVEATLMQDATLMNGITAEVSISTACPLVRELSEKNNTWIRMRMTAEYYVAKRRLIDGITASLETLASLDAIRNLNCESNPNSFGKAFSPRFLPGVNCRDLDSTPTCRDGCFKLKRDCGEVFDFSAMVQQSDVAKQQADAIEAELARIDRRWWGVANVYLEGNREWESDKKKINSLSANLKLIGRAYPWIEGERFKARYGELAAGCKSTECESRKSAFACEATKSQAVEIAVAIQDHLAKFREALSCLDGTGDQCGLSAGEFREIVGRAPLFEGFTEDRSATNDERSTHAFVNWLISDIECRTEQHAARIDRDKALRDYQKGVALTLLTAGTGMAARHALNLATKAATAGRAAQTARLSSIAAKLEAAGVLIDLADVGRGLHESISECANSLEVTSRIEIDSSGEPQCPGARYQGPNLSQDYRSCVLRATAWELATGLLPVLPSAVSRSLNLSKGKEDLILEVIRKKLSAAEAAKKFREADFAPSEIYRLLNLAPDADTLTAAQRRALAAGTRPDLTESERFIAWKGSLNDETRNLLKNNPDLDQVYRNMDPRVRRVLTRCGSPCLPEGATEEVVKRLDELLKRLNLEAGDERLLSDFFHHFRANLKDATDIFAAFVDREKPWFRTFRLFSREVDAEIKRLKIRDDDLVQLQGLFVRNLNRRNIILGLVKETTTIDQFRAFAIRRRGQILSWNTKLPNGTQIYTPLARDGEVYVKYRVGDSIKRGGHEKMLTEKEGWHRAHLVPPGHGVEDPGGLSYATKDINLRLDKFTDGIIERAYLRAKLEGNEIHVIARIQRHSDGSLAFKSHEVYVVSSGSFELRELVFAQEYRVFPSGNVDPKSFKFVKGKRGWNDEFSNREEMSDLPVVIPL